jgi:fatty acid desaturase
MYKEDSVLLSADTGTTAPTRPGNGTFAELSERIKGEGLLDSQPRYYTWKLALNASLFAAGLAGFIVIGNSWWQVLIAVYMGFAAGQCLFMQHDAGHKAMFRGKTLSAAVGLLHANLVNGASYGWWVNHHNRHHSHPNNMDLDPDIRRRTVIFDMKQYPSRRGYKKLVVRHQSILFFVFLPLEALKFQRTAVQALSQGASQRPLLEGALILARAAIYLGLLFTLLSPAKAIVFFLVQQGVQGTYFGLLFAPNHKGMEVRSDAESLNWLDRQVITSRNIRPSWYMDFLTGGLNYQIEHHLFPTMPQKSLRRCREIVQAYCAENGIRYHEVGFWQSYREVAVYLHNVSAPVRAARREPAPS